MLQRGPRGWQAGEARGEVRRSGGRQEWISDPASSYSSGSPMGLDVALEEINHLLEVDLSNSSRMFKGDH